MKRLATPLAAVVVFVLNVWLAAPLFMRGELPFRGSIEGGYVGMAGFIYMHPNPWGWNPLQYCGLPTQSMYVPALPYATAAAIRLLHADPDHAWRVIVSLLACLGPVTVFFFALHFTGRRRWSLAAALGYSFLSLAYQLFPAVEKDRGIVQLPWRIQVLAKYGEGPHNAGLTLLPLALLAVWLAASRRGYGRIFVAAVLLAAVPLTNWVAAFALAIACLLLLLAALGEPAFQPWRVAAAAGLAYLLACFWLTPGFIRTILSNWPTDSFDYQFGAPQRWLAAGLLTGVLLIRLAFRLARGSFYLCFVTLGGFVFGWISTAWYVYGMDTIPESRRYAIEFELFAALALVEGIRLATRSQNPTVRLCAWGTAAVALLMGSPQLWAYATQGWRLWAPAPRQATVEYKLSEWIARHPLPGRVFATGGLRFRMNSWFDIAQVGGAFETGLRNRMPWALAYRIRTGKDMRPGAEARDTLLELETLGAGYVVVHGPKSQEYYHDFVHPERLSGLPVVYREGDDAIYALPPRPLAHLVSEADLPGKDAHLHPEALAPYVAAMDDPSRPVLRTGWLDSGTLGVDGAAPAGLLVAVKVNADPGWSAVQDGRAIPIEPDNLGFMVLRPAPAAATHIELRYRATAAPRWMAALSALAWAGALAGLWAGDMLKGWRKRSVSQTTN